MPDKSLSVSGELLNPARSQGWGRRENGRRTGREAVRRLLLRIFPPLFSGASLCASWKWASMAGRKRRRLFFPQNRHCRDRHCRHSRSNYHPSRTLRLSGRWLFRSRLLRVIV
jgi:hypothetical protein